MFGQSQRAHHPFLIQNKAPDGNSRGLCFGSNGHGLVTNSLRPDGIRWDEIKDLAGIQNQNGIKHNRMGQDQTGVFQLQIRYGPSL